MYPKLHLPLSVAISIALLKRLTSIVSDSSIRYSAVIPFISPIFCSYKFLKVFKSDLSTYLSSFSLSACISISFSNSFSSVTFLLQKI